MSRTTRRTVSTLLGVPGLVALLGLAACGGGAEPVVSGGARPSPGTLEVAAGDAGCTGLPPSLGAGRYDLTLVNTGRAEHELLIVRTRSDRPVEEVLAGGPEGVALVEVAGQAVASAGGAAWATVDLRPGRYTVVCAGSAPGTGPGSYRDAGRSTLTVVA